MYITVGNVVKSGRIDYNKNENWIEFEVYDSGLRDSSLPLIVSAVGADFNDTVGESTYKFPDGWKLITDHRAKGYPIRFYIVYNSSPKRDSNNNYNVLVKMGSDDGYYFYLTNENDTWELAVNGSQEPEYS